MNKEKLLRNSYIRLGIVISTALIVGAMLHLLFTLGNLVLFTGNPNFTLANVVVNSSGYWNNRSEEIMKNLGLVKGETNIFDLNFKILRKHLQAQKDFSIENVELRYVLPDTLLFKITECIPRAALYNNKNSNLILDDNDVLINKERCSQITNELPIIAGFKIRGITPSLNSQPQKIPYGRKLYQLKPALILISLVDVSFPEFDIKTITLSNDNELTATMQDPLKRKLIIVRFPFTYSRDIPLSQTDIIKNTDLLKTKLKQLKKLYTYLALQGKNCTEINLLYTDQAVVR